MTERATSPTVLLHAHWLPATSARWASASCRIYFLLLAADPCRRVTVQHITFARLHVIGEEDTPPQAFLCKPQMTIPNLIEAIVWAIRHFYTSKVRKVRMQVPQLYLVLLVNVSQHYDERHKKQVHDPESETVSLLHTTQC
jgi:hypothetical protein